ncbi:heavy-metal-associated domain-containing protein [Polynucleobacter sp. IMCC30063]|uniref:heavy-metal-associated domain-containing protein n=1 Tax=unclassified Polynucleobacter TaxID=2640945 RepID=UPI001F2E0738|nr:MULTISPECIES: heavy metal-associated domain-containing protein [unclassified Polynucleobacter]MCE7504843.1 heavy-metal-associated domain-containing protein [Polynucleobacter sp. IMCC30063]MCE7526353.1 heavy-metal-associated domain-containing protein [Polynucleobacter sp. IMCC 30228]
METINLTVSDMTCDACVKQVEKVINSIAGVQKVEVDLACGAVKVVGNISQHAQEIVAALEEDGYRAQVSTEASNTEKSGACKSGSSCCCN